MKPRYASSLSFAWDFSNGKYSAQTIPFNYNFTYFLVRQKLLLVLSGEFSVSFRTQVQQDHASSPHLFAAAAHRNGPKLSLTSASSTVAGKRCRDNKGEIDGSD